jgi:hypothetical protein
MDRLAVELEDPPAWPPLESCRRRSQRALGLPRCSTLICCLSTKISASIALMSPSGHSRPGRASSKSGRVRYAPKAEMNSEHWRLRDGLLWVDGNAVDVIQGRHLMGLEPDEAGKIYSAWSSRHCEACALTYPIYSALVAALSDCE